VADDRNPLEDILRFHAEKFRDAAGRCPRRAARQDGEAHPWPLLADLEALIAQLDDVQLVGNDIALHLVDVSYCDARY
jgi:hypothetical protein